MPQSVSVPDKAQGNCPTKTPTLFFNKFCPALCVLQNVFLYQFLYVVDVLQLDDFSGSRTKTLLWSLYGEQSVDEKDWKNGMITFTSDVSFKVWIASSRFHFLSVLFHRAA